MILPIYAYGNAILKREGKEVTKDYPKIEQLFEDMFETCKEANGIGLAAQQVGYDLQLFIIDLSSYGESDKVYEGFKKVIMNSIVIEESEETEIMSEGCLSFPGVKADVERPIKIKVEYLNEKFETVIEELEGLGARVFLHEHEHTEGINFIDHTKGLRKRMLKKELGIIKKGGLFNSYKIKFA